MTLKIQMTSDIPTFLNRDEFAKTISYTAIGNAAVDITAIVTRDSPFQEPYVRGEETATSKIDVATSEVPNPQYGDYFTFDSETWDFEPKRDVTYKDDDMLTIELVRRD